MNRKLTKFALMTNKEIYRDYLQQLRQLYSPNEAALITDWIFEKVTGLQRADIIKNPGHDIHVEKADLLKKCLIELLQHKPVQYVLGEAWFYGMKLKVNEDVLIPRPETEELVQLVITNWQLTEPNKNTTDKNSIYKEGSHLSMLDIGTGSGCIAIAVKKHLQHISMSAIDVNAGALSVAKENATTHKVDIQFLSLDFLNENCWENMAVFDVIISNPPYIPINEKEKLDRNVTHFEPHTALFVPDNQPMLFYEKIANFGKTHLNRNGKIYVEMHEDFVKETVAVFEAFYNVAVKHDIFGKQRMLIATNIPPSQ